MFVVPLVLKIIHHEKLLSSFRENYTKRDLAVRIVEVKINRNKGGYGTCVSGICKKGLSLLCGKNLLKEREHEETMHRKSYI